MQSANPTCGVSSSLAFGALSPLPAPRIALTPGGVSDWLHVRPELDLWVGTHYQIGYILYRPSSTRTLTIIPAAVNWRFDCKVTVPSAQPYRRRCTRTPPWCASCRSPSARTRRSSRGNHLRKPVQRGVGTTFHARYFAVKTPSVDDSRYGRSL